MPDTKRIAITGVSRGLGRALFIVVLLLFEPAQAQPTLKKGFEMERVSGGRLIAAKPELAGKTKAWVWYAPDWALGES